VRELSVQNRRATIRLAERLAPLLGPGDLVVLSGDLGSGKTFLARALCRALGVGPEVQVTSPTFTLVHEFEGRLPIRHADAYRLKSTDELLALGLRDALGEGAIVLLEWGEPYVDALGGDALLLVLEHVPGSPTARRVSVRAVGPRSLAVLERFCP
jgi:tRNA threonylcarbamoyladenosine biosynthesis protein TsaE